MTQDREVFLGAFAGAHGVKGHVKIKTFTESEAAVAAYGPVTVEGSRRILTLRVLKVLKPGLVLATAPEIESREDAASLASKKFFVSRAALAETVEEDAFFHADLVGLEVIGSRGEALGRVCAVHNFGAGDILELKGNASALMASFTEENFPCVDTKAGVIKAATWVEETLTDQV